MIETRAITETVQTLRELYEKLDVQNEEITPKELSIIFAEVLRPKEYEQYRQKKNGEERCHTRIFRQWREHCFGKRGKIWLIEKSDMIGSSVVYNRYTVLAKKLLTFKKECEELCEGLCNDEHRATIATKIIDEFDLSTIISVSLAAKKINKAIEIICDGDELLEELQFPSEEMSKIYALLQTRTIFGEASFGKDPSCKESTDTIVNENQEDSSTKEAVAPGMSVPFWRFFNNIWSRVTQKNAQETHFEEDSSYKEETPSSEEISSNEGSSIIDDFSESSNEHEVVGATHDRPWVYIDDRLWNNYDAEKATTDENQKYIPLIKESPVPGTSMFSSGFINNILSRFKPKSSNGTVTNNTTEHTGTLIDTSSEEQEVKEPENGRHVEHTATLHTSNGSRSDFQGVQRNFSNVEESKIEREVGVEPMDVEEELSYLEEMQVESTVDSHSYTESITPTDDPENWPRMDFVAAHPAQKINTEIKKTREKISPTGYFLKEVERVANGRGVRIEKKRIVIEVPDDDDFLDLASIEKQGLREKKVKLPRLIVVKQEIPTFLNAAPFNKAQHYLGVLYSLLSIHKALFGADGMQIEKKEAYFEGVRATLENIIQAVDVVKDMKETKRPIEMYRLLTRHMYAVLAQLIQYQKEILPESEQYELQKIEKTLLRNKKEFFNWKQKTTQGDLAVKNDVELYGEVLVERMNEFFKLKFWKSHGFSLA